MPNHPQVKEFSAERELKQRQAGGKRPEAANHQVLAAVAELREEIGKLRVEVSGLRTKVGQAAASEGDSRESLEARVEIAQMVRMIGRAKMEIASIRHPHASADRMDAATNELDAIVLATETSTEEILAACETIERLTRQISGRCQDDNDVVAATEEVAGEIIKIFEACNFQDITGQRITKVVKAIRFIEERILAMINIWGIEAFAELPLPADAPLAGDEGLMNGPALPTQGISQDDINALFD